MFVNIAINVTQDDKWQEKTAEEILVMLGGDPTKDSCTLTVTGTSSSSPPPPEVPGAPV